MDTPMNMSSQSPIPRPAILGSSNDRLVETTLTNRPFQPSMAKRFPNITNVEYLKDHEAFNSPQSAFISNTS